MKYWKTLKEPFKFFINSTGRKMFMLTCSFCRPYSHFSRIWSQSGGYRKEKYIYTYICYSEVYEMSIRNPIVLRGSGKETDGRMFALGLSICYSLLTLRLKWHCCILFMFAPIWYYTSLQRCQLMSAFWKTHVLGNDILWHDFTFVFFILFRCQNECEWKYE